MDIVTYQQQASSTIQQYRSTEQAHYLLGYLGLAGETGSVLTTLKKMLRDGEAFGSFIDRLEEELGDVLWYVAAIASHHGLSLERIAQLNLEKTTDRFREIDLHDIPRFDSAYEEQFPDEFVVRFVEEETAPFLTVKMIWEKAEGAVELGDPLTDNSRLPNQYRYHDVFHLGHVACLGWSPVLRHLMKLKRKSDPIALDAEDRGRPQVAEEAVTLIVYNYAKGNKMLQDSQRLDTELLTTVRQLVLDLEVAGVSSLQWEKTILLSYQVFHQVVANRGGRVLVSPGTRKLVYLGH